MICPKCGNMVEDGNAFCPTCGASTQPVENTQNTAAAEPQPQQPEMPQTPPQPPVPPQAPQYTYGGNTTPPPPQYNPAPPSGGAPISGTTYLVLAIVDIVICCLPFGIAALVYALKIDKLAAMGDYAGAQDAASKAKKWLIISPIVTVIGSILYFILMFALGMSGSYYY